MKEKEQISYSEYLSNNDMEAKKVLVIANENDYFKIKSIGEVISCNTNFILYNASYKSKLYKDIYLNEKKSIKPDFLIVDAYFASKNKINFISIFENYKSFIIIPIITLGTYNSNCKINNLLKEHSNCWLQKPNDENEFEKILQNIFFFWFKIAKLPNIKNN